MKTTAIASLLALTTLFSASAGEGWMTDIEAAKKKAAAEKKILLIDFTGSDWCPPCIKLKEDVFDQEAFSKGAADHYVLVELDFPRDETKISKELAAQNEKLAEQYNIQGFPTVFLTDPQGRPIGMTGFREEGPEAYLTHLASLGAKMAVRDAAFAKLEKAKGEARAAVLEELLGSVPRTSISGFYGKQLEELAKLNPKAELIVTLEAEERAASRRAELDELGNSGKFMELAAKVDEIVKAEKLQGLELQKLLVYKVGALVQLEKFMDAVAVLDQVILADEESEYGQGAGKYKLRLLVSAAEKKKAEEKASAPAPEKTAPDAGAKAEAPKAKEVSRQVSAPVKVPTTQVIAKEEKVEKPKKKAPKEEGRKEVIKPAKGDKTNEQLKKELEAARKAHKDLVTKVNSSHDEFEKIGKVLVEKRAKLKVMSMAVTKAAEEVRGIEVKLGAVERAHNEAHAAEEKLKLTIAEHLKELQRREEIAALEKQLKELNKKAEALRKKADELRK